MNNLVAFAAICEYNEVIIMDNWILKSANTLVNEQQQERTIASDEVKVKVAYVLASNFDAVLYSGEGGANYPKTIGRFAVGRVTEVGADCYGVERNTRVLLKPTRPCGKCLSCKTGKEDECSSVAIAGRDFDGFLRDFVVCKYTDIAPLPNSVNDIEALCTEAVALAERIYATLALPAGSSLDRTELVVIHQQIAAQKVAAFKRKLVHPADGDVIVIQRFFRGIPADPDLFCVEDSAGAEQSGETQ